jgi:hypothetical protein
MKRKILTNPYLPTLPRRHRVRGRRGFRIYLPPLDPEQAWTLVILLDRIINALWRAHGDAMADYQGRVWPDLTPPPDAEVQRPERHVGDDEDF